MLHIHLETEIAAPVELVFDLARDVDFTSARWGRRRGEPSAGVQPV
jgi:uncharacterized protein YndB with AHSA1/START domain